jgi:hypothetical protein
MLVTMHFVLQGDNTALSVAPSATSWIKQS